MSTFLKAFKFASIIALLNAPWILLTLNIENSRHNVILIIVTHFFIPPFLAVYNFRKNIFNNTKSTLNYFTKSAIITFTITYLLLFLQSDVPFFNIMCAFNGVISIIVFVFSTLIFYLSKNKKRTKTKNYKIHFSIKNSILISLCISSIYFLLFIIFNNNYKLSLFSYLQLCLIASGLFAALFTRSIILYISKQSFSTVIKNAILALPYIINTLCIPFFIVIFLDSKQFIGSMFIVAPFYLMNTLAIHVYYTYLLSKQEKENLKQIGVTASLKYQQVKAQLSPHFLFNNISVLTGLIEEDQTKAITFSENLSNVYRYFLDQEKQDIVTLKEEMSFASKYLDLLKVRYENALMVNNIVTNSEDYYILPMALQQVFENVIKHNEISIEQHLTIDISNNKEYLTITNNINPKIIPQTSSQTGLENIINRYSFFTDKKVIATKNATNYSIKLPLLKIEA